jgi:YD repeat-containing protein
MCDTVAAASSALPAGGRKTSTEWHPDWSLAARVAAPGVITTSVYNGRPDPFTTPANTIASCAPTTALLPNNKPIAVLCRQVEQATTDTDGALGFAAPLAANVARPEQRWTYNEYGQVLTHDGPRTDVLDRTTYTYHPTTTAFVTRGDLASVANPAGQVTRYTQYDKLGQLLESTDPNGVVTTRTYDLRQRLKTVTVGVELTQYDWWPTGKLKQVTQPDGSWLLYTYDDAHRLREVKDSLGNYVEYDLDNAGIRRGENTRDPQGTLRRQLSRTIDALGRVEQTTGRQ